MSDKIILSMPKSWQYILLIKALNYMDHPLANIIMNRGNKSAS